MKWLKRKPSVMSDFCDPIDSRVHGILQASILDWVAFPFSRGSSKPRDQTQVSRILERFFTIPHCRQILHQLIHQGSPTASQIHFCQFFNAQFFSTSCHHITVRHNHSWLWMHRVFFFFFCLCGITPLSITVTHLVLHWVVYHLG